MNPFVARLINSQPTLDEEQSRNLAHEILSHKEWILFNSNIIGWDEAVEMARYYTTHLSEVISTDDMSVRTEHPVQIFRIEDTKRNYKCIGLLYSNGAVTYMHADDRDVIMISLDRSVADALNIPYVDIPAKRVYNLTAEQAKAMFDVGEQQPDDPQAQENMDG